jgi:hypothetical protein
MDLDSTVCEVHGHAKGGAAYGYTHRLGYHPLLATRADTGELLQLRMRTGSANTARGAERFVNQLAGRVRRAGQVAADAAGRLGVLVGQGPGWLPPPWHPVVDHGAPDQVGQGRVAAISEDAWTDIDYPDGGAAQVARPPLPARQAAG